MSDSSGDARADDSLPLAVFDCPLAGIRLIEASAGTGKTWNICGLYLRLLLEQRLTVQQILVVTFTNAATAELRDRIRQRIVDVQRGLRPADGAPGAAAEAAADPFVIALLARLRGLPGLDDDTLARLLDAALQTFDEAAIFTIHGFCQRALADTPFAAGLPLVQELLRDDSALRMEVVHDFWRQRVAAAGADEALVAHLLAVGDSPERYARLLQRGLAKPLARLLWPAAIATVADAQALAAAVAQAHAAARTLWQGGSAAIAATLQAARSQLNASVYRKDTLAAALQGWQALLAQPLADAAAPPELPPRLALLGSASLHQRTKKGHTPPSHPFFDAAQALLEALQAQAQARGLARLRLLRELLSDGAARLRQAKRSRRVVAFDDMLYNLHERLGSAQAAGLAAALLARFPAALIDEFQDTDPLQFAVFEAIYGSGAARPPAPPPLFLVGDPKQAIYSFRHADLHTYLRARALAVARYTLLDNQRATEPLIAALNRLFGLNPRAFMQPGLHYHPVAKGAKPQPPLIDRSAARAPLQIWTLPDDARSGQPLLRADALAAAAASCAGEIARLLSAAADGAITLGGRALRAGDIAVLVRSHAQGSQMRQALATLGVGSVELSQASIFQSSDAEELERVLAALLEPGRESLLKAALATRWLGLGAAQIDALAGDEAALGDALQRQARHGATWRTRGVGFMLRQWLHDECVAERLLAAPDGARRLTNLLHLAECLHQAAAEQPSPEALLRWLQAQRQAGAGDETTQLRLDSDRHLVQIVTIHKSKGLEYPLVFCPFLWDGRPVAGGDGLDGALRHDESGAAVIDFRAGFDAGFDAAAARAEARAEAAAEFLRLVYVALTRAVQRCYLVAGNYRVKSGRGYSSSQAGRSLLHWLVAGAGITPDEWLAPQRKPAAPEALQAAWNALGAVPLPEAWRTPLAPPRSDGPPPQALPAPAAIGEPWWIGSYSALVYGAATDSGAASSDRAAADHDLRAEAAGPADAPTDESIEAGQAGERLPEALATAAAAFAAPALAADDMLGFPRGAAAGDCVHAVLEWAEFTDAASWPAAIERALARHPPASGAAPEADARHAAMLGRMLGDVLGTALPVGTAAPLRLATLPRARRLAELEFHLHAPQLVAADLQRTLADLGYPLPALAFGTLQGYLKGFIDLVFEHDGRYFIADWKSNHLGWTAADYGAAPLAAAMRQHLYTLQSLIYSLALHRWLAQRLPGYRHERHFGGALYLFVRGLRPGWVGGGGRPAGLHFHRVGEPALERLSALLHGGPA